MIDSGKSCAGEINPVLMIFLVIVKLGCLGEHRPWGRSILSEGPATNATLLTRAF